LSPVINTTLGNLGHNSGAGSQRMTKSRPLTLARLNSTASS
jgi:hypothetical protein